MLQANKRDLGIVVLALAVTIIYLQPLARETLFYRSIEDIKWMRANFKYGWIFDHGHFLVSKEAFQITSIFVSVMVPTEYWFVSATG